MKKFSKIYENNIISSDAVKDIFSDFLIDFDCSIKVYDYYKHRRSLFQDITNIEEGTRHAKIAVISFNKGDKPNFESLSVSGFSEMGFNSSGFIFLDKSVDDIKQIYDGLLQAISRIDQYEGKLWFKGNKIVIYLLGDKVNVDSLTERDERIEIKRELSSLLNYKDLGRNDSIDTSYWIQTGRLSLNFPWTERMFNILDILLDRETEETHPKKEDLIKIREMVKERGYNIKLSNYNEPDRGNRGSCVVSLVKI